MKKFLTFILVLAMVLSVSSVALAVSTTVADEAALREALANADDGDTITLSDNISITNPTDAAKRLTIDAEGENITLNLGGKTLVARIDLKGGNLTVTNGTVSNPGGQALNVYADQTDASGVTTKLTVLADATVSGSNAVVLFGYEASKPEAYNAQIDIYGTVEGSVFVSGNIKNSDSVVNINSPAKVTANDDGESVGIALNGNATVNIEAGTEVKGATGVEVRAGTLNVSGGTITATAAFSQKNNPNGTTTTGVAVAVSQHTTNSAIDVNVSGGTLNSGSGTDSKALYVVDIQDPDPSHNPAALDVSGGDFNGAVTVDTSANLDNATADGFITGGAFSADPSAYLESGAVAAAISATEATGSSTTYGVGKDAIEEAAEEAAKKAGAEKVTVTVTKGDVAFGKDDLPGGATVKNSGTGNVTVAGTTPDPSFGVVVPTPVPEKPASTGSGISVKYNGGNSFSTSNPAVPTGVEIDGVPVTFNGTGSNFTVGCISSDAKWVTVRWNSTSVTTNFTPDGLVECTTVSIPKTGDMSIWAAIAQFLGF